jgi:UDP-N-acetylglucosamine--N-acetylmuramyl-(pentapeptide) pyrophosphoryl-undecaprenol N-acetylglucosamine transferase
VRVRDWERGKGKTLPKLPMSEKIALLAAGGTGGHLFPAQALALELKARGWRIHLATDHRVATYGQDFPAEETHLITSATLTRAPVALATGLVRLGWGLFDAWLLLGRLKPAVVVGFGGYPTLPPMLAAAWRGVPTIIHEQNAVIGRANGFLASRVTAIATSQGDVRGTESVRGKLVQTGNPVRPAVLAAAQTPYHVPTAKGEFRLVVFGGSQGARFMSDLVPPAVMLLPETLRSRLRIVQQCRAEDMMRVKAAYAELGVQAYLASFFHDLPQRIADGQLVVCRSGASTTAELTVIGRPAIMVPLPGALDQDQRANATVLAAAGGGWMVEQKEMTPERLAADLASLMSEPARLSAVAQAAKSAGRPDAVARLADVVERVAAGASVSQTAGVTA